MIKVGIKLTSVFMAGSILFGCSEKEESKIPYLPQIDKPDFTKLDGKEKKEAFFDYMYPIIVNKNIDILNEIDTIQQSEQAGDKVLKICEKYSVNCSSNDYKTNFTNQVNVIPPSLALTQAAKESGWGTSRFSREGNNYFGQWCYKKGCGIIPKQRNNGARHEVAKFKSPEQSVEAYLFNLNTHSSYDLLRDARNREGLDGAKLASGLVKYSEQREKYVKSVKSMIKHNNLSKYDKKMLDYINNQNKSENIQ